VTRIVGDEFDRKFFCNEMCRGRAVHEYIDHFHSVFDPTFVDLLAENHFRAALVPARVEIELAALDTIRHSSCPLKPLDLAVLITLDHVRRRSSITARVCDRPPRKTLCYLDDVCLCVSTVDA